MKKSKGLFSYIRLIGWIHKIKYFAEFYNHFTYMINLLKNDNKKDNGEMKTIGKYYDILQIIEVVQDINNTNRIVINILFVMSNDIDNLS